MFKIWEIKFLLKKWKSNQQHFWSLFHHWKFFGILNLIFKVRSIVFRESISNFGQTWRMINCKWKKCSHWLFIPYIFSHLHFYHISRRLLSICKNFCAVWFSRIFLTIYNFLKQINWPAVSGNTLLFQKFLFFHQLS